jgi:hypothetical protein
LVLRPLIWILFVHEHARSPVVCAQFFSEIFAITNFVFWGESRRNKKYRLFVRYYFFNKKNGRRRAVELVQWCYSVRRVSVSFVMKIILCWNILLFILRISLGIHNNCNGKTPQKFNKPKKTYIFIPYKCELLCI